MRSDLHRKVVAAVPMLKPLTEAELDEVLSISRLLKVNRGVPVIKEAELGNSMYIIVSGRVRVVKDVGQGERQVLAALGAGEVFGEMALIDLAPRSASVETLTNCLLYQIDLDSFNKLRRAHRPAAYKILRQLAPVLCQRLRRLDKFAKDVLVGTQAGTLKTKSQMMSKIRGEF